MESELLQAGGLLFAPVLLLGIAVPLQEARSELPTVVLIVSGESQLLGTLAVGQLKPENRKRQEPVGNDKERQARGGESLKHVQRQPDALDGEDQHETGEDRIESPA